MNSISHQDLRIKNILPHDGEVEYFGITFTAEIADRYFDYLLYGIPWKNDTAVIFGKYIVTKRKVAWYGDADFQYNYSGTSRDSLPWTKELLEIKEEVEKLTNTQYNSVLLNLYHDGHEGMGWHHDDEKGLGKNANIASVSFGATRRFDLRYKLSKEKVSIDLSHGSLVVMRGTTQAHWHHQIAKQLKVTSPRINLTFRQFKI